MKSVVLLLCCFAVSAIAQEFSWKRRVMGYNGRRVTVTEKVTVVNTADQKTILMSADDLNLRATPFYRSESLHDFDQNLVALKPVGSQTCFLTTPRRGLRITLAEIRRRADGGRPRGGPRNLQVEDGQRLDTSGNDRIDRFCQGRTFLKLVPLPNGPLEPPFPVRYPPLWCLWGPIDPSYPDDGTVPAIEDFQGGFGFFP